MMPDGARGNHQQEQGGHGVVDFEQAGGQAVEQRPLAEAAGDDALVGVDGLFPGDIQQAEELAGVGFRAALAHGAGAHGQGAAILQQDVRARR